MGLLFKCSHGYENHHRNGGIFVIKLRKAESDIDFMGLSLLGCCDIKRI